jgi:hypothetical protein
MLLAVTAAVLIAVTGSRDIAAAAEPNSIEPEVSGPPAIIKTSPEAFAKDVDPAMTAITVTFNQKMRDGSWSWTGGGETYPEPVGSPSYLPDMKTCQRNVKLQPGKVYWIGVNSPSHKNFKNERGEPAPWYIILFATKDADGKPTPIPDDLLKRAQQINKAALAAATETSGGASAESGAPAIVKTVPEAFANDVNPAAKFIAVTFDRKMRDGSWSWTGGGETYPELAGSPSYLPDMKTCRVNVKLERARCIVLALTAHRTGNFKSEAGVSAPWYILLFATKDAAGNPTPIPDDMLEEARRINAASGAKVSKSAPGKSYRWDRSVDQFEKDDDFSTPEAAYATINKLSSQNKINWKQVSAAELAPKMKDEIAKTPADWARYWPGHRFWKCIWPMKKQWWWPSCRRPCPPKRLLRRSMCGISAAKMANGSISATTGLTPLMKPSASGQRPYPPHRPRKKRQPNPVNRLMTTENQPGSPVSPAVPMWLDLKAKKNARSWPSGFMAPATVPRSRRRKSLKSP